MDLQMPVLNGIEATQRICQEFPAARILIVTTYPDEEQSARATRAGAMGHILKDAPREELLNTIRGLLEEAAPEDQICRRS
jgi:DNA-binding NarL/FixJ family response regulator